MCNLLISLQSERHRFTSSSIYLQSANAMEYMQYMWNTLHVGFFVQQCDEQMCNDFSFEIEKWRPRWSSRSWWSPWDWWHCCKFTHVSCEGRIELLHPSLLGYLGHDLYVGKGHTHSKALLTGCYWLQIKNNCSFFIMLILHFSNNMFYFRGKEGMMVKMAHL